MRAERSRASRALDETGAPFFGAEAATGRGFIAPAALLTAPAVRLTTAEAFDLVVALADAWARPDDLAPADGLFREDLATIPLAPFGNSAKGPPRPLRTSFSAPKSARGT